MKINACLLFLVTAVLVSKTLADTKNNDQDYVECENCFDIPYEPVCAYGTETFRNMCELKCNNAELKHVGECTFEDLLANEISFDKR